MTALVVAVSGFLEFKPFLYLNIDKRAAIGTSLIVTLAQLSTRFAGADIAQ